MKIGCGDITTGSGVRTQSQERIYGADDYHQVTGYVPEFTKLLKENAPEGLKYSVKYIEDEGHVPFTSLYDGLNWIFEKA